MNNPISMYRIQFHKEFTFDNLKNQLDYLDFLGVSTIYASPIFAATPGSMHGYDSTNPQIMNPEIGTYQQFDEISLQLKKRHMGWLQDIVPNHMAFNRHNPWVKNLLKNGINSNYAGFFDVDFEHPHFNGKIMVPFLGNPTDQIIEKEELNLTWHNGAFAFRYFDNSYPVSLESLFAIFENGQVKKPVKFLKLWNAFVTSSNEPGSLNKEWNKVKESLRNLYLSDAAFKKYIISILKNINDDKYEIRKLLNNQHYELCYWRETEKLINYRRFFTVNDLICLKIEKEDVFNEVHRFIIHMVKKDKFQGLRIDHIDGLYNPIQYLTRLRSLAGNDTYIVVEKILGKDEKLPKAWPIQGNTGYDFITLLNGLLTNKKTHAALIVFYHQLTKNKEKPAEVIYNKKKLILTNYMQGELDNLNRLFEKLNLANYLVKGITTERMKSAIGEFIAECPVYKLYSTTFPFSEGDKKILAGIFKKATRKHRELKNEFNTLEEIFLKNKFTDETHTKNALHFFMRCMQFTGPVMAKGVEDTAMYCYNGFLANNEVGDSPEESGITTNQFHEAMNSKQIIWPLSINATSTHDTKRSEDVRARLFVISDLAEDWLYHAKKWVNFNKPLKGKLDNQEVPSINHEYFIYQTLSGFFPMDGVMTDEFNKRIEAYLIKALRESKENTNWNEPNEEYENETLSFTRKILDPAGEFLQDFVPFQKIISDYGMVNSLSMLVLKCICPGIPDIYQGTELWDFSLVDPDNRRPVDYTERFNILNEIKTQFDLNPDCYIRELYKARNNGWIKLWLLHLMLAERRNNPDLFTKGEYIPLKTRGKYKDYVLAFARNYKKNWYIVAVSIHYAVIAEKARKRGERFEWGNTRIILPYSAPEKYIDVLNDLELGVPKNPRASFFFRHAPVMLLKTRN